MDNGRFDRLTGWAAAPRTRRRLLASAGFAALAERFTGVARKGSRRKKRCENCCRPDGRPCKRKKPACKPKFCLGAPLSIEAIWTQTGTDHESYLFVPNAAGDASPAPYIKDNCNPTNSDCEDDVYPFACVSQDADGPPGEVTTIRRLLPGTYEYWMEVYTDSPPGDLQVTLRDKNGRAVRAWTGPTTGSIDEVTWHVFDLDGSTGRVRSVDQLGNLSFLPNAAHDPASAICPGR